jgi:hypothetical protein
MASEQQNSPAPEQGRKRLNLKPRDPEAAAKFEAERQKQLGSKVRRWDCLRAGLPLLPMHMHLHEASGRHSPFCNMCNAPARHRRDLWPGRPSACPAADHTTLGPRSRTCASLHTLTARRLHPSVQNPFGAAKPREAVIAEKTGKTEEEVLKEELSKDKLHVSAAANGCAISSSVTTWVCRTPACCSLCRGSAKAVSQTQPYILQ